MKYRTIVADPPLETPTPPVFPFSGICANCLRERDDLFQHPDGCRYCVDVFACEVRYYIQGEREGRGEPLHKECVA